jgi:hypothetical protein
MWKLERAVSFLGIHKLDLVCIAARRRRHRKSKNGDVIVIGINFSLLAEGKEVFIP